MLSSFDCVVVTSSNPAQGEYFEKELLLRKEKYFGESCRVIALSDPLGYRVGSGGATFHAIAEAYNGSNLLILHSGGDSRRNPLCTVSGKAFVAVNFDETYENSTCPLDRLLQQLALLLPLEGVLIAATDTLMTHFTVARSEDSLCFSENCVTGVGIFAPCDFGTRHGVFYPVQNGDGRASFGILQKASLKEMESVNAIQNGSVILDSGIIHIGKTVVNALVNLMKFPPFLSLTNRGLDSGVLLPIQFDLYTDFVGALQDVCPRSTFIPPGLSKGSREIRQLLCQALELVPLAVHVLSKDCKFIHVGTTLEHLQLVTSVANIEGLQFVQRRRSFENIRNMCHEKSVIINSFIEGVPGHSFIHENALVEHSKLNGNFNVGENAIVSHVSRPNIIVPANMVLQQLPIDASKLEVRMKDDHPYWGKHNSSSFIFVVFGVFDGIKDIFPSGTFANRPWTDFKHLEKYLWTGTNVKDRSLWNAKLYPVCDEDDFQVDHALWLLSSEFDLIDSKVLVKWKSALRVSLSDLVWISDISRLFHWRHHELPNQILSNALLLAVLRREPYPTECFHSILHAASDQAPESLVRIKTIFSLVDEYCERLDDESLSARILSLIADLLAGERQPRSGDAGNPDFSSHLLHLSRSRAGSKGRVQALRKLVKLRDSVYWSKSMENKMRVARHYDVASQSLVGRSMFTGEEDDDLCFEPCFELAVPFGIWVHSTAPARIDLSGGWSDTPPITFEYYQGGAVCNVAVTLNPLEPCLGASVRRYSTNNSKTEFMFRTGKHDSDKVDELVCGQRSDFNDHFNPRAPHALLKSVLLALFPVDQLFSIIKQGIEICVWSILPPGSGLGGSSILAACAVMSICRSLGISMEREDVVRVVLKVEQLLSTGGGWQDQIGAIFPLFKIGQCAPTTIPVDISVVPLEVPKDFLDMFEARVILIQTGPARLARDLLQNVIRRWHRREASFCDAIGELIQNSQQMKNALVAGDFEVFCEELNRFWRLKRFVAGREQAEPPFVKALFDFCDPFTDAHSLCGAGGGGFAVLALKSSVAFESFKVVVEERFPESKIFRVSVCHNGLYTSVSDKV